MCALLPPFPSRQKFQPLDVNEPSRLQHRGISRSFRVWIYAGFIDCNASTSRSMDKVYGDRQDPLIQFERKTACRFVYKPHWFFQNGKDNSRFHYTAFN
jgi:hypothetical protein